jgi:hypothetical protein
MDYTKPMKREAVLHSDYLNGGIQFCSPYAGRVALSFRTPTQKIFGLLGRLMLPVFLQFHA